MEKEKFETFEERLIIAKGLYSNHGVDIPKGKEKLAVQSITMPQYAKEYNDVNEEKIYDNGGLSTLGDAVCGAYVMHKEFKEYSTQESLTNKKVIVKNDNLNILGEELLSGYLFARNNDLNEENKKSYATAFEAFIGFIYLINKAKAKKVLDDHLKMNFKESI